MRTRLRVTLMIIAALGPGLSLSAQPPTGSKLPFEENGCALCHGEESLWAGEQKGLYVPPQSLSEDVHSLHGVNCHDCHGGDAATLDIALAHATEVRSDADALPFRKSYEQIRQICGNCHQQVDLQLRKSVHARAERESDADPGEVLHCNRCHGATTHGMLPVADRRSPVYLNRQVDTCGGCHEEDRDSYMATIHGKGLFDSGLVFAAVCSDCHGAHGIYYAADERSTLYAGNVADQCGKCHEGIGARLEKSVHSRLHIVAEKSDGSGSRKWDRVPTCTDCHQGHRVLKTASGDYRSEVVNYCGNCHPNLTNRYAMSTHGELTDLGYSAAAKCPDCHGAHDILPLDDPNCMLAAGVNRLATCRQCHTNAVQKFSEFDPHADHKNAEQYPTLYHIYSFTHNLFLAFLTFFVVHALLWFVRSFLSVLRGGRHRTLVAGQYVIERFTPANRVIYVALLISFLGLTATGLPLKFSTQRWAQVFVRGFGGFEYTSVWHHVFATIALLCCVAHIVLGFRRLGSAWRRGVEWREIVFGPDSLIPSVQDAKDMVNMGRWFIGLGPKPKFERWTYWEKYDYWMTIIACVVVGTSGLMMWFPNAFCLVMSGESLNVARVIHVELAVMATSFLFVFHFYHSHFRPEKFPIDMSAVTGLVNEEHLREHRPEFVARLEATNAITALRRPTPSRRHLWVTFLIAALLFTVALCLLGVALAGSLGK